MASRSRPPVRAIFFDAGNTLLRMNYPVIAAELAARGAVVTAETLQRAEWRARVRLDEEVLSRQRGVSTENRRTGRQYLRLLLEEAGVRDEALIAALGEWRSGYNLPVGLWNVADPDADAALRLAREGGLTAAVISNSNGSVRMALESVGLARHLDFVLDSTEVGVEKPDPRIFALALERAGLAPTQAVYVGDMYSIDVVGARAAGLDAVLLDPGACWGRRDCRAAAGLLAAVKIIVGYSGSVTNG